jgi:putative tricarboxylic transport membrane protein
MEDILMKRRVHGALLSAALGLSLVAMGQAQDIETLRILVPAAPGGGWDQTGRALQQALQSRKLVNRVTVENRTGAGGTIGLAQFVSSHKSDPHALMVTGMVMVGAILLNKSPMDLSRVTPIARLIGEYEVIVVPADSKIQSFKDLITQLRNSPGSVSWGGGSAGGTEQILAAMIAQAAGVDASRINYIPYSGGGEALAAILGGHVTVGVSGYGEFAAQIQARRLRPLALSADKRIPGINIPTLKEQGFDVELSNWRAVFGAPEITEAQKQRLVALLQQAVKTDSWQDTIKRNQWTDLFLAGNDFKSFLGAEQTRIGKTMESIGLIKR